MAPGKGRMGAQYYAARAVGRGGLALPESSGQKASTRSLCCEKGFGTLCIIIHIQLYNTDVYSVSTGDREGGHVHRNVDGFLLL